jgi:hypothetical protein
MKAVILLLYIYNTRSQAFCLGKLKGNFLPGPGRKFFPILGGGRGHLFLNMCCTGPTSTGKIGNAANIGRGLAQVGALNAVK